MTEAARVIVCAVLCSGVLACHRMNPASGQGAQSIALEGATVLLPDGSMAPGTTILIEGERIKDVGPSAALTVPSGARRVDARGRWVIPGLWDMHVHLALEGTQALPHYVASGVTSVRDMGGQFEIVHGMRQSIVHGAMGPSIFLSGPQFETPASMISDLRGGTEVERQRATLDRVSVADTLRARIVVDSLVRLGVDFIKIRNVANAAAYWAIIRAARRHGLMVAGHAPVGAEFDWIAIADSGQRSFEHWFYPENLRARPADEYRRIVSGYKRSRAAMVPTHVAWLQRRFVYDSVRALVAASSVRGQALGVLAPIILQRWENDLNARRAESPVPRTQAQLASWERALDALAAGIGQLHREGVLIMAGSDLPTGRLPGEALLDEVVLLVERSGLSPVAAIQAASSVPADFMGVGERVGSIGRGQVADLVVLDGDPTQDINNIRRISRVIRHGAVVEVRALGERR